MLIFPFVLMKIEKVNAVSEKNLVRKRPFLTKLNFSGSIKTQILLL